MGMKIGRLRDRRDPLVVSVFDFYRRYGLSILQRNKREPIDDLAPALRASLPVWEQHYSSRPADLRIHAAILVRWCLRWGVEVPVWVRCVVPSPDLPGLRHFAVAVFHVPEPDWLTQALVATALEASPTPQ